MRIVYVGYKIEQVYQNVMNGKYSPFTLYAKQKPHLPYPIPNLHRTAEMCMSIVILGYDWHS